MTSEALGYHDEAKELVDALELEHGFYEVSRLMRGCSSCKIRLRRRYPLARIEANLN